MNMILDVDVTAEGGIIKLIARKGNPQPSGPKGPSNLRTFARATGVNLKNLFS